MSKTARIEQARLRQQVFLYFASCIRRGQVKGLVPLSIRPDQLRRIADLRAHDLVALGELSGASIVFDIDPEALDEVFASLEVKRSRMALIEQCLRREAPRAMMQRCFGLSRHRYAKLKSELGVDDGRGRARQASPSMQGEIHRLWRTSQPPRTALTLLKIAEELGITLRPIWDQVADDLG